MNYLELARVRRELAKINQNSKTPIILMATDGTTNTSEDEDDEGPEDLGDIMMMWMDGDITMEEAVEMFVGLLPPTVKMCTPETRRVFLEEGEEDAVLPLSRP